MPEQKLISILETYDLFSRERKALGEFSQHIEAPNWTSDGAALVYNSGGLIYRYDLSSGESSRLDTGGCTRCNNDHVLSADGRLLAISAGTEENHQSRVWVLPATGGEPRLVTEQSPSYLHGISPDGKTLSYCAQRNCEFDIYICGIEGGGETRLTDAPGLNDGPEYSPDGEYLWFNSVRAGNMQVFRMRKDGLEQTQMTFDAGWNSWFPHISPDGREVVFVAYRAGEVSPGDHPANKSIEIRRMSARGGDVTTLMRAFGGQGTMNVNSWAPDSRRFAFVTYRFG